ncbi:MAG: nucleotidyl transferase AbiEii/AbiGii toxin family protein [Candidatus Wallbacteria bacterium]|nr:nucleotidyl transferase AbiEii/AbiGii toxin family protein [Candidatus Wallbacteria bacterium]
MKRKQANVSHSLHERLLNLARQSGRSFNDLEHHYAMERFLFRLGCSPHVEKFVLKGALMLVVWTGASSRATRDIDLLGRVTNSVDEIMRMLRDCLLLDVPDDGIRFDPTSVVGERITLATDYPGVRIRFSGTLGNSRLAMQVDVGFGDAIVPAAGWIDYPVLLDDSHPHLLGYTPESVVDEKLHAIITRDLANTRLKDYHDIAMLAQIRQFDGAVLVRAIQSVFERRRTPLPTQEPPGLSSTFSGNPAKQAQWRSFLRRSRLSAPTSLAEVVEAARAFLLPPVAALADGQSFELQWTPPGPWLRIEHR